MRDIFSGGEDSSPELQLFDTLASLEDFEEAVALYRSYLNDDIPAEEAFSIATADLVPRHWLNASIDQLPEQPSS